jgi:hypothetical protein
LNCKDVALMAGIRTPLLPLRTGSASALTASREIRLLAPLVKLLTASIATLRIGT